MEEKNGTRTLTFLEQKAHEGVLRLVELGMVPNRPWCAINMGRVKDVRNEDAFGGTWKIKEREVAFGWKHDSYGKIILEMTLRAEIPLERSGEEMQSTDAQSRWFIVGIKIFWLVDEDTGGRYPGFELNGESSVDILLNGTESSFFKKS